MTVLVTAATEHGATGEIAEAIAQALHKRGLESCSSPQDVSSIEAYDAVVLGSHVYTGHWLKPAKELVERSANALAARPVWLFSSGPVGDPSRKLVQKMGEDPVELATIGEATRARDHHTFAGSSRSRTSAIPSAPL